ncbi:MAG: FAD-binding protein [Bdellovibrionales bacterium]|nr:FAD-binding protein [Bdellovibrionales bacterium]
MPKTISNLKVGLDEDLQQKLSWMHPSMDRYVIRRKAVDARRGKNPSFVYSIDIYENGETPADLEFKLERAKKTDDPVLIVGAGPAGLFAALRLSERGIPVKLIEQGSIAEKRIFKINRFWRYGELNPKNNVGFGEGGAGLYSDGKLITRIKSPHIPYVLKRLVDYGAPEEILYLSNPHVGSDKIRRLIPKMREHMRQLGAELLFDSTVEELLVEDGQVVGLRLEDGSEHRSSRVILACGHSAEELFESLHRTGVFIEGKSFAMGLRIEHPQHLINKIQYREAYEHPKLGAANYRITHHDKKTDTGVYSFCMCPGGYVLSSGTHDGQLVSNGMSNFNRNSKHANAAIVVTIDFEKSFGKSNIFAGLEARKNLESSAYHQVEKAGGDKHLPAQNVMDFLMQRKGEVVKGSTPSGTVATRLDKLFGPEVLEHMTKALEGFEKKMPGFVSKEAQFFGVESRTSCPIRITRDKQSLQSVSHKGLYPTGEGAGYAGGITSAACDGINVAEKIYHELLTERVSEI